MKLSPMFACFALALPVACTPPDEPAVLDADVLPCAARTGDLDTVYEYDARGRLTRELTTRGGAPVHEVSRVHDGDLVRVLTETRYAQAPDDLDEVAVTDRTIVGGRIVQERFTSSDLVDYVEDLSYDDDGRLERVDGALDSGRTYERVFWYPDATTELMTARFLDSSRTTLRTRHGGPSWTLELDEGPGVATRHERWFDETGRLTAEEKHDTSGATPRRLLRRDVVRKANGAPSSEVVERLVPTATGEITETTHTEYRYACDRE